MAFVGIMKSLYHRDSKILRYFAVLSIVLLYFVFVSLKYGVQNGAIVTALTWSFFVFCTPIADAGFLIDLPFRLITHFRMIYSEMGVWVFATLLNIITLTIYPEIYTKTIILRLFYHIIIHPIPFWLIPLLSAAGTFLSVHLGDETIDMIPGHESYRKKIAFITNVVSFVFIFAIILVLYDFLLTKLGIQIPLL